MKIKKLDESNKTDDYLSIREINWLKDNPGQEIKKTHYTVSYNDYVNANTNKPIGGHFTVIENRGRDTTRVDDVQELKDYIVRRYNKYFKESISSNEPVVKFQGKSSHTFTKDKKWEVDFDEAGNIVARTRHGKPLYFKGHINDKVNDFPSSDEDNIILAAREQHALKFGKDKVNESKSIKTFGAKGEKKLEESANISEKDFIEVEDPSIVDKLGFAGAVEIHGNKIYADANTLRQLENEIDNLTEAIKQSINESNDVVYDMYKKQYKNLLQDIKYVLNSDNIEDIRAYDKESQGEYILSKLFDSRMNKQNMSFEDAKEDVIDFLYRTRANARSELELRNKRSLDSKSIMNKVKSELSKDYKLVSESENTLYFKAPDNSTHDDCIAFVDKVVAASGGKYTFTARGGSWTLWDILTPEGSYIKAGYDYSNKDNYAVYFRSILTESRSTRSTSKESAMQAAEKYLVNDSLTEASKGFEKEFYNDYVILKNRAGDGYDIYSYDGTPEKVTKAYLEEKGQARSSRYSTYFNRIKKAIAKGDEDLLQRTKEAIMYAPAKELKNSEASELMDMIKNRKINEAFDVDKVAKRIARHNEFDNGYVLHDYERMTSAEAEEKARLASIENPDDIFYVSYDNIMEPCSDIKWKNGKKLSEASYGGAFDIEDDQYFTREEINELGEDVVLEIGQGFELTEIYLTDNILEMTIENDELGSFSTSVKIDMRRISKPHDIFKYKMDLVSKLDRQIEAYKQELSINESLKEDIEMDSLEAPKQGPEFGLSDLLNNAIKSEFDAISIYNELSIAAESEGYDDIVNIIADIATEENKHVGQLQEALKLVAPQAQAIEIGYKEGQEQIEETNSSELTESVDSDELKSIAKQLTDLLGKNDSQATKTIESIINVLPSNLIDKVVNIISTLAGNIRLKSNQVDDILDGQNVEEDTKDNLRTLSDVLDIVDINKWSASEQKSYVITVLKIVAVLEPTPTLEIVTAILAMIPESFYPNLISLLTKTNITANLLQKGTKLLNNKEEN